MGIMPNEFYSMEMEDFWLMIKGWVKKESKHHDYLRHATMIIACSGMNGKEIVKKFERLWPSINQEDKKESRRDKAKAQLKKFKEIDQKNNDLQKVKELMDGRRS